MELTQLTELHVSGLQCSALAVPGQAVVNLPTEQLYKVGTGLRRHPWAGLAGRHLLLRIGAGRTPQPVLWCDTSLVQTAELQRMYFDCVACSRHCALSTLYWPYYDSECNSTMRPISSAARHDCL